jgi:hypothetical protein
LNAQELISIVVGELSKCAQFGLSVSEVIAVRIYDGHSQCTVVALGYDKEVDLEGRPFFGVILIGNS